MNNLEDIRQWKDNAITKIVLKRLEQYFDPHNWLLGAQTGTTVDLCKGQRQVIDMLRRPEELFDETKED